MPTLIQWLDSIQSSGENLMLTDEDEKLYIPFIINRGLAQGIDTVMFAQEVNKAHLMPKPNQYRFLLNGVKKAKRYNKWAKKNVVDERISIVQSAYNISMEKAAEYMLILTDAQIEILKAKQDTGGVKGRGNKGNA